MRRNSSSASTSFHEGTPLSGRPVEMVSRVICNIFPP